MKRTSTIVFVKVVGLVIAFGASCSTAVALAQVHAYSLTIYVNEGAGTSSAWIEGASSGVLTGHVFIGLSDGTNTMYRGYYPNQGYKVVDDLTEAATRNFDVAKTFVISQDGFQKAQAALTLGEIANSQWRTDLAHCGAYAEAVAQLSGVSIQVPEPAGGEISSTWRRWMRTRPGRFGDYLRSDSHPGQLAQVPTALRNKLDPSFYAGPWKAEDGRIIVVTRNGEVYSVNSALPGEDARYFREFRLEGAELTSKHTLTVAEVQKYNLPPAVIDKVAGVVPVQMILVMSTDARAIRAEHDQISGVNVGRLYHNGKPTNSYRINSFVPESTYELWVRVD